MTSLIETLELLHKRDELSLLELEFGRFLVSLEKKTNNAVIIAGICCVRNQIQGNICISIDALIEDSLIVEYIGKLDSDEFKQVLLNSELVNEEGESSPLILDNDFLYTQKFRVFERELANWILNKASRSNQVKKEVLDQVDSLFEKNDSVSNFQKIATKIALIKDLLIITGGPGTGKTYTVKKIIEVLGKQNSELRFALAAPTGKAAQRLSDSLAIEQLTENIQPPTTIHKLLGAKGDSGFFKYNLENTLPYDVIIIDEASMLDLNLWIRLLRTIPKSAKLVLLGDKNQLASVEAGSILGDITKKADNYFSEEIAHSISGKDLSKKYSNNLNDCIVELSKSYRFSSESGIDALSKAINNRDEELVLEILNSDIYPNVKILNPSSDAIKHVTEQFAIHTFQDVEHPTGFQILCALRRGPFGVIQINSTIERAIKKELELSATTEWYEGRRVLFTKNNSIQNYKNGEIAICRKEESTSKYELDFLDGRRLSSLSRIQDYEPAFATTIHKSQGSEYNHVAILLPDTSSQILSKELLYTAVTRARESVLVIGTPKIISSTVKKSMRRKSGLERKIWVAQ